jgi:hypothetical protein
MIRKQKWMLLVGLILLAVCMTIPGISVMASNSATVSGMIPLIISNVAVSNITTTSATISWNTNNPAGSSVTSQVSYGITNVSDTSSGLHSVNLSSLSPGTIYDYQILSTIPSIPTASYTGSFTTVSLPLHPQPSPTNIVLVSIPNPSDVGQTVDFGVAVIATKLNGIPTGTVTYFDGKTQIGTSTLNGLGLTSFNISTLTAGSHNITAVYGGDTHFLGSTSNIVIQKVHYDTKITLTSSVNPSISGQSVTFTATVTAAAGTPTGTVTFSDGFTVLGTGTLSGGKATYTTSALSVGSHPITASYGGDPTNDVSTSNVLVQVVNSKPKATVNLSSSLNPSVYGQSVSFTATLSPSAATGTVQFQIDGTNFGSPATLSGGKAVSGSTTTLSIGSHNITATYSGDSTYGSSTASLVQKVLCKTVCTWPSKPNPCNWGLPCIFNVQIGCQSPGTGFPTGTVTFYDSSNNLGSCSLSSNGSASFSIGNLGIGSHNISFTYNGDDNDGGSTSSAVTQLVNPINTSTSLSSSVGTLVFGQSVNFTASVTPNTATGTVTFKDGNKTLGTATLSGGSATLSINSLAVGSHSITAVYGGDTYDSSSTSSSITETVTKPVIGTISLPNGTKNSNYNQTLSVSGGSAPYTWSISGATSWLSLSASGVLSGKPTASGTYNFTVKVTDSLGNTATQSLSIKVN